MKLFFTVENIKSCFDEKKESLTHENRGYGIVFLVHLQTMSRDYISKINEKCKGVTDENTIIQHQDDLFEEYIETVISDLLTKKITLGKDIIISDGDLIKIRNVLDEIKVCCKDKLSIDKKKNII